LIVVDSSGWLEFFSDGPPRSEEEAIRAVAMMKKTRVIELTEELALAAADLSLAHELSMADSMMLAVARAYGAELTTTAAGFAGIDGVLEETGVIR